MLLAVHFINKNDEKAQFSIFLEKCHIIGMFWQLRTGYASGPPTARRFAEIQPAVTLERIKLSN